MGRKILIFIICIVTILTSLLTSCSKTSVDSEVKITETDLPTSKEEVNNQEAFDFVASIGAGWNLGNTLDSTDFKKQGINSELTGISPEAFYETYWGNPETTKKMIDEVAAAGFKAVRVPVTYYDHMNDEYIIYSDWLDRVEEIVNYVLNNNMYCIINLHHEEAWLNAEWTEVEENSRRAQIVWKQIANRFKSYDEDLIFEGFNELINKRKNWTDAEEESYDAINTLNQVFVDSVRSSTGYNKERYLIVNTYAANVDEKALSKFQMPQDIIDSRLIVSVHAYIPQVFNWNQEMVAWTTTRDFWTEEDEANVEKYFNEIDEHLLKRNYPVILGEFASVNKNNEEERVKAVNAVVGEARERGIAYFWWDSGGRFDNEVEVEGFALLNREKYVWYYPEIVKSLTGNKRLSK